MRDGTNKTNTRSSLSNLLILSTIVDVWLNLLILIIKWKTKNIQVYCVLGQFSDICANIRKLAKDHKGYGSAANKIADR
jgi:hypothetical protein